MTLRSFFCREGSLEPAQEIMALFVLRTHSLNAHAQPSSGARCLIFGRTFRLLHTSCVRTAKALARLRGCAESPEPSLVAYLISTIISSSCTMPMRSCVNVLEFCAFHVTYMYSKLKVSHFVSFLFFSAKIF